jgi:serine/threonine protein kinase
MESTSACTSRFRDSNSSDSRTVGKPNPSAFVTAVATSEPAEAISSATVWFSGRSESGRDRTERGGGTSIEEQIERSRSHWSEVAQVESDIDEDDEEAVRADNIQVFKALQLHPTWGTFFATFGHDFGIRGSSSELVMGEKFAEGGQVELYEAQVKWWHPQDNECDLKKDIEYVLKVFKQGTLLRHLQSQLPQGLLQDHVENVELSKVWEGQLGDFIIPTRHSCEIFCGILLKDGRFAFLMKKEDGDLRSYIDCSIKLRNSNIERIIYGVALGMDWLHIRNIVHRDLKASNVLFTKSNQFWNDGWACYVADFECSIGVIGTGFFRAPEILQACKNGNASQRPYLFTKAADVYSYGMTCYEILSGKLPFEGHSHKDYINLVLEGQRPKVPEYVDDWIQELLRMCWQSNREARPTFGEILRFLEANSVAAKALRKKNIGIRGHTSTQENTSGDRLIQSRMGI